MYNPLVVLSRSRRGSLTVTVMHAILFVTVRAQDVERLAQEIYKGGSPSSQMLLEVGAKAMETSDLVELLHELQLEDVLTHLVELGELRITVLTHL